MYSVSNAMKETNLCELGNLAYVNWDSLDAETKAQLTDLGYDEDMLVDMTTLNSMGLSSLAEGYEYDDELARTELENIIKDAPYYLVMAHNCRWNGASGYKIVDNILTAFYREHDASIYPSEVSKGGKCLICREYSHDVPTGATTSVTALTEKEYEKLQNCEWAEVESFAIAHEEAVA